MLAQGEALALSPLNLCTASSAFATLVRGTRLLMCPRPVPFGVNDERWWRFSEAWSISSAARVLLGAGLAFAHLQVVALRRSCRLHRRPPGILAGRNTRGSAETGSASRSFVE